MGSDWTSGPAKWAAVGALGSAAVFGMAWSVWRGPGSSPARVEGGSAAGAIVASDGAPARAAPGEAAPAGDAAPAPKAAAVRAPTRTVDLNTATQGELELLPGIGPALASRILEERRRLGRFGSVEQLDDVQGIGPKLMARLRPLVRVEPAGGGGGQAP